VSVEFEHGSVPSEDDLVDLYGAVGWTSYTADPAALARAVRNSPHVVTARDGGVLVGLARVLTDDVSIVYVQDVLGRTAARTATSRILDVTAPLPDGLAIACDLAEAAAEMVALRYRRDHPGASCDEVASAVDRWWSDRRGAPLGDSPGRVRERASQ